MPRFVSQPRKRRNFTQEASPYAAMCRELGWEVCRIVYTEWQQGMPMNRTCQCAINGKQCCEAMYQAADNLLIKAKEILTRES